MWNWPRTFKAPYFLCASECIPSLIQSFQKVPFSHLKDVFLLCKPEKLCGGEIKAKNCFHITDWKIQKTHTLKSWNQTFFQLHIFDWMKILGFLSIYRNLYSLFKLFYLIVTKSIHMFEILAGYKSFKIWWNLKGLLSSKCINPLRIVSKREAFLQKENINVN